MKTIRNITFLLLCGLGTFVGDAFGQEENCDKGERGDRAAMRDGGGRTGARGGGAAQSQSSAGQGLSPQQTAERMLSNFDADGDGALNMQELSNGLAALQQSMLQQRGRGQGSEQQTQRGQSGSRQQQANNGGQRQRQGRANAQAGPGNSSRPSRGGSQRRGRQVAQGSIH